MAKLDEANIENMQKWVQNNWTMDDLRGKKIVEVSSPAFKKFADALQNRNFESLKKSSKVVGLKLNNISDGLVQPEFDLYEVAAAFDAEPYVRRVITRQINLWFKKNFKFVGENNSYIGYVQKRFKQIAYVSGVPTVELFRGIVFDLLKYSNAFIVKVRNKDLSAGSTKNGTPIAGYYQVSPLKMYPYYDDGELIKWIRFLNDGTRYQEFAVKDVIHFTFDREPDFLFGKPRLLGVIEDIAALRRIEENVEVLIVKYLFPFFHFKVGTDEAPCQYFPNGSSEIDVATTMLNNMEQEGMLVTSERFNMEAVGAENKAMDAKDYLQHFKMRVFTGLGVSPVDMGEGDTANRSTADSISQNLKDLVIQDQKSFAAQVQHYMIAELFLEHPDDVSALNAYDEVNIGFANVDLDNQIKEETHAINLFNNNMITEDEGRIALNRTPLNDAQRAKTHFSLIEVPGLIISAADEPFTKEAKQALKTRTPDPNAPGIPAPGTGGNTKSRTGGKGKRKVAKPGTPASRPVMVKIQPENQFGVNPGPTKRKSSTEKDIIGEKLTHVVGLVLLNNDLEPFEDTIRYSLGDNYDAIMDLINKTKASTSDRSQLRSLLVSELAVWKDIVEGTNNEEDKV